MIEEKKLPPLQGLFAGAIEDTMRLKQVEEANDHLKTIPGRAGRELWERAYYEVFGEIVKTSWWVMAHKTLRKRIHARAQKKIQEYVDRVAKEKKLAEFNDDRWGEP